MLSMHLNFQLYFYVALTVIYSLSTFFTLANKIMNLHFTSLLTLFSKIITVARYMVE